MPCLLLKKTGPIYKLYPVLEDGLHRLVGRLSWTAVPQESKQPIILDHTLYEQALDNWGKKTAIFIFKCMYKHNIWQENLYPPQAERKKGIRTFTGFSSSLQFMCRMVLKIRNQIIAQTIREKRKGWKSVRQREKINV